MKMYRICTNCKVLSKDEMIKNTFNFSDAKIEVLLCSFCYKKSPIDICQNLTLRDEDIEEVNEL